MQQEEPVVFRPSQLDINNPSCKVIRVNMIDFDYEFYEQALELLEECELIAIKLLMK